MKRERERGKIKEVEKIERGKIKVVEKRERKNIKEEEKGEESYRWKKRGREEGKKRWWQN